MRKTPLLALGLVVTGIVALGLIVLSSASQASAIRLHHGDAFWFMKRQFLYVGVGLGLAGGLAFFDYRRLRQYPGIAWVLLALTLLLLIVVFVPQLGGITRNGSTRWIRMGPINVQPSELAKLVLVVFLSVWLDRAAWRVELLGRGAVWPFAFFCVLAGPIILEPDFGSVFIMGVTAGLLMVVAGTKMRHLLLMGVPIMGAGALVLMHNANRVRRILGWFGYTNGADVDKVLVDTSKMDPAAYQVHMSLVALKNGGIWGVGLGNSMQKLRYLPEAHTDFIFAIGAEELGLRLVATYLLLIFTFFGLSIYIARNAADRLGRFLVVGMAFLIFFQSIFNLGVVCDALPTKGIAMPFFSYGGTNILVSFMAVGVIFSVGIHSLKDERGKLARSVILRS